MSKLSFAQLQDLWIRNGGNPLSAPIMAAIALAESGGQTTDYNGTAGAPPGAIWAGHSPVDESFGLWQVNYKGSLAPGRTAAYGSPAQLLADPDRQAKAAIAISGNGTNLKPWTTFTNGSAQRILTANGGSLGQIPALPDLAATSAGPAGVTGGADDEGLLVDLTMPSAIPNIRIPRSAVRRLAGVVTLAAGGIVGLAGVFVLAGAGGKAPGPTRIVTTALRQRGQTQRTQMQEEGRSQRQTERSTRARQPKADVRDIKSAKSYRSARAEGEAAAAEAGPF